MPAERSTDPLHRFCRAMPGVTEDIKWSNDLCFSVGGKIFAVFPLIGDAPIGVKVDPMAFHTLTSQPGIVPAPYAARFSWISVTHRRAVPAAVLRELIADSYRLVAMKLPKKTQAALRLDTPLSLAKKKGRTVTAKSELVDGAQCTVVAGTHKGKSGTVRDIKTSKTGAVTITVVPAKGERFKTLAKNVIVTV